jgi:TM2 domain-containing membrane protein YozV
MDKMNKILYLVIVFFIGGLGIHKFLNGRIVPGVVQLVLSFIFGIGALIALVEFFYVIFCVHRPEGSDEIEIPKGFFDFLKA